MANLSRFGSGLGLAMLAATATEAGCDSISAQPITSSCQADAICAAIQADIGQLQFDDCNAAIQAVSDSGKTLEESPTLPAHCEDQIIRCTVTSTTIGTQDGNPGWVTDQSDLLMHCATPAKLKSIIIDKAGQEGTGITCTMPNSQPLASLACNNFPPKFDN